MALEIRSGKISNTPQKAVIYGPEGIGKSTFAAAFPNPLFIDTEGSTKELDVKRLQDPSSWSMLLWEIDQVKADPSVCKTLIVDTADWAEKLCMNEICSKNQVPSIESFGYGKGYVYLEEEFGRFLNKLSDLIEQGINVVITAHAALKKFEQPNESGAYDRWELKLQKKVSPLLKEWSDMLLFANYEVLVMKEGGKGETKKAKASGGKRVMYTSHHPCWDAKNRKGLPEKMDFKFETIAEHIPSTSNESKPVSDSEGESLSPEEKTEANTDANSENKALKQLFDLMTANDITRKQVQNIVSVKGYFPENTPLENYPEDFIQGVLVGAWEQVRTAIINEEIPF